MGEAEARVSELKVEAQGDPRLYAMNLMATQPPAGYQGPVPGWLVIPGSQGEGNASPQTSLFQTLMSILTTPQATQQVQEEKGETKKG